MDQIKKVPIFLSSIKDLQNQDDRSFEMQKLRQDMKSFMKQIKSQFSTMIGVYEKQISTLKMESQILKGSRNTSQKQTFPKRALSIGNKINKSDLGKEFVQSPVLPLKTNQFYRTANSQFYCTDKSQKKGFPSWDSAFEIRNISPKRKGISSRNKNQFPEELINPEFQQQRTFHRSRYQRQSQIKRQKQQQIVHFLQSHQKNLNETTFRMMDLIGLAPKNNPQNEQGSLRNQNEQSHIKDSDQKHNRSLSQICDSLDKSFVSQKARKNKMKKRRVEQQANKKKVQQQTQNQKIRKQKTLKNLLQRLRQNANSTNPPEIVKASKLIPTGVKTSKVFSPTDSIVLRKNTKVMINPTPLKSDRKRDQSPNYSEKRPTSILKQSSYILTRSISGISAISFQE